MTDHAAASPSEWNSEFGARRRATLCTPPVRELAQRSLLQLHRKRERLRLPVATGLPRTRGSANRCIPHGARRFQEELHEAEAGLLYRADERLLPQAVMSG